MFVWGCRKDRLSRSVARRVNIEGPGPAGMQFDGTLRALDLTAGRAGQTPVFHANDGVNVQVEARAYRFAGSFDDAGAVE